MLCKKISLYLFITMFLLFFISSIPLKAGNYSNFSYSDNKGEITIEKYNGKGGNVVIPEFIEGKPVTEIGRKAFNGCTGLKNITIPDKVTVIGDSSFTGCTGLLSITIPHNVTLIGYQAFSGCASLADIKIPDSVISIYEFAFAHCTGLKSISLPEKITEIPMGMFASCTALTSVTLPAGITKVGGIAFAGCISLSEINVKKENKIFESIDGVLFSGDGRILRQCPEGKKEKTYIIPDGVNEIEMDAFSCCTGINSIIIPAGVTIIGERAFSRCTGLKSVTIPGSVNIIQSSAFFECTGVTIYGYKNSFSEEYSKHNRIPFQAID